MTDIVWAVMQGSTVRELYVGTVGGKKAAYARADTLNDLFPRQRRCIVVPLAVKEA